MDNKDVVYLTAEEEENHIIGQGNAPLNEDGTFIRKVVKCRQDADFPVVPPTDVDLMDVAPQQIASVSAGLILPLKHKILETDVSKIKDKSKTSSLRATAFKNINCSLVTVPILFIKLNAFSISAPKLS